MAVIIRTVEDAEVLSWQHPWSFLYIVTYEQTEKLYNMIILI